MLTGGGRRAPSILCQIDRLNPVPLHAKLHEAVHALQPIEACDLVPVRFELAQVPQALQLCVRRLGQHTPHGRGQQAHSRRSDSTSLWLTSRFSRFSRWLYDVIPVRLG